MTIQTPQVAYSYHKIYTVIAPIVEHEYTESDHATW